MTDPRSLLMELYGNDVAQPVDLYGATDELPTLPWQQQEASPQVPQNFSRRIQEALGAIEPNTGGTVQDILSGRFNTGQGPSIGDYSQGLIQSALGKPQIGNESGIASRLKTIMELQKLSQRDYRAVRPGEKLIDPNTGETVYDAGPEKLTPYQEQTLELMRRRLNMSENANNGLGKPPTGYRWNADNELEAIPGGPATKLTPEGAAKTAQVDNALGTFPEMRRLLLQGVVDPVRFYAMAGDIGQGRRLVKQAVEAYLRATSGAAVPEPEVERALQLYEPKPYDLPETKKRKLDQLENFLKGTKTNISKGRTIAEEMQAPQDNDVSNMSDEDLLRALNSGGGT